MATLMLGGLASGIDTDSVISQLLALERAPQARLKLKESTLEARQSALNDVATRLRSLQTAIKDLSAVTTWADGQPIDVSDATRMSARRLGGTAPGAHTLGRRCGAPAPHGAGRDGRPSGATVAPMEPLATWPEPRARRGRSRARHMAGAAGAPRALARRRGRPRPACAAGRYYAR